MNAGTFPVLATFRRSQFAAGEPSELLRRREAHLALYWIRSVGRLPGFSWKCSAGWMLQENDFKISASCFASEDRCLEIRGKMQSKVWQPQIGRALLKARLNFRHRFFAKLPVACHTRHDGRSAVYIVLGTVRRTNCMIRCEWPQRRSQGKQITRRADRTVGVASSRRKHRSRW